MYIYVCMYVCMYVFMYVCMHVVGVFFNTRKRLLVEV